MFEHTTLRDELARDRTMMANERTLLAYGRTALGLLGLAIFVFKFSSPDIAMTVAPLSLAAAFFVFFWGLRNYRAIAARLAAEGESSELALSLAEAD